MSGPDRKRPRLRSLWRAALAGAFFVLVLGRAADVGRERVVVLLLFGALYGVAVHGLMRLFTLRAWGYPVAGLLCGGVPLALLARGGAEETGGGVVLGALFGLLLGLLEWSVLGRRDRAVGAFGDRPVDAFGDRAGDA